MFENVVCQNGDHFVHASVHGRSWSNLQQWYITPLLSPYGVPGGCVLIQVWTSVLGGTGFSENELKLRTLRWRYIGPDSDSTHQPHGCLLSRLFRRRSKKTSKLRVTGLSVGNSPGTGEFPVNSPHKWPVTRKMCPFDDVIMIWKNKAPGSTKEL